ncbi:MAG: hypothetical protein HYU99_06855 [Deltaproteobacteria bacterium]|nr:hypothetical protein [Deltaproteobacteria bacterium]
MSNEISQKQYPDPRTMDPWDYQAAISGYKNGEEFKQVYMKEAKKAVLAGSAAGIGVFAGAFGLCAGGIMALPELPGVVGALARFGSRALAVAKNVGVKAWEVAKSGWYSVMGGAATPQGQEAIKNTVECVESFTDGSPAPSTAKSAQCYLADKAYTRIKIITE